MIWLICLILVALFIIINILIDISNNNSYNKEFDWACELSASANREYLGLKESILKKVEKFYGKETSEKLDKGTIVIGMNKNLVKFAYGKPEEIKEEYRNNVKIERWYYSKYVNRLGNTKYKLELLIENNLLEGWKDL